jgi:hypothetical protein
MRTTQPGRLADHDLLQDIDPESHHPPVEKVRFLINSQSIPALTTADITVALTYSGHQTIRVILRGPITVQILGHAGVSVVGGNTTANSTGIAIAPYGGGGYLTSYMGAYSRLHGDTYLSQNGLFGTSIVLQEVFINGTNATLRFYNTHPTSARNLTVYGLGIVK